MKIIKELSDMIEDELEGAENYSKLAVRYKEDHPSLADTYHEISIQEMRHVNMLHDEVVKIIKSYRDSHGEPPAAMAAIYDWQHKRQIEKTKEVKILQSQYNE